MKKQNLITIHIYPLAQFILKNKIEFSDLRHFNIYKKEQIYLLRNQHLSKILHQVISNSDLETTEYGKPYLINYPHLSFNHSHSQQYYALAISQSLTNIGVDVEDLSRKVRYEALAWHAFHPNELNLWKKSDLSTEYWFKVWTTKEAVLKASGLGIRISLNELDTQVSLENDNGVCHHPAIGTWCYQNFCLNHIMLTVAWAYQDYSLNTVPTIEIISH